MDAALVFRLISLVPDRSARAQSGSVFTPSAAAACRYPDRMSYLGRFLHWLGPLDPMTKEDQQILGVRSSGGRPLAAGEEAVEELDDLDDLEDEGESTEGQSMQRSESGTLIAPAHPPSIVGG
jgi:hypothetical protein